MLPKTRGSFKETIKTKVLELFKARASQFLVCFRPPQVCAAFSPLNFVCFETSSRFGKVLYENEILQKPEDVAKEKTKIERPWP